MPISKSDAISGTIYVIALDAEQAQDSAFDYLRDKSDSYNVFDDQKAANAHYYDRNSGIDRDVYRVYAVTLDIRAAGQ